MGTSGVDVGFTSMVRGIVDRGPSGLRGESAMCPPYALRHAASKPELKIKDSAAREDDGSVRNTLDFVSRHAIAMKSGSLAPRQLPGPRGNSARMVSMKARNRRGCSRLAG